MRICDFNFLTREKSACMNLRNLHRNLSYTDAKLHYPLKERFFVLKAPCSSDEVLYSQGLRISLNYRDKNLFFYFSVRHVLRLPVSCILKRNLAIALFHNFNHQVRDLSSPRHEIRQTDGWRRYNTTSALAHDTYFLNFRFHITFGVQGGDNSTT